MCLVHDLPEARTTDLNYVHQKYAEIKTEKAIEDLTATLPFGDDLKKILHEYEERQSLESKLAKDADTLEWILSLKEQMDIGNLRVKDHIDIAQKRLKTDSAKSLGHAIMETDSNDWWFSEKTDSWWVTRNKE
jgi:putative hydrolase of HD superfamily